MSYNLMTKQRIAYDLDGTEVGYNYVMTNSLNLFNLGIQTWLNNSEKEILNRQGTGDCFTNGMYVHTWCMWFFFPEKRIIDGMACLCRSEILARLYGGSIQGSNDTTNGVDGTWETATYITHPLYPNNGDAVWWRNGIRNISFSESKRVIRISIGADGSTGYYPSVQKIHIYGNKATDETPNDIMFCESDGTVLTVLKDWGDRPEGSTSISSTYIKNTSMTQTANNIVLSINHTDFLISLDNTTWSTDVTISSLSPNTISQPIYIKNTIGASPQILGIKASRIQATIDNWI